MTTFMHFRVKGYTAPMPELRKNASQGRYELVEGGEVVGFAEYREESGTMVLPHTVVDPGHEGEGLGSQLARFALDDIRQAGKTVVPSCAFIRGYIEKHPEYADLVAGG